MRAVLVGCAMALGAFATGCGTKLADPGTSTPDADDTQVDAQPDAPVDAMPDAMPTCSGGDGSKYDPSSMTCMVYFNTPKQYAAAETSCEGINGKLLVIKSADTNAVAGTLTTKNTFIGATDQGHEMEFRWLDDPNDVVGANMGYSNWRTGEPNNNGILDANMVKTDENCTVLEGASATKTWDDKACVALTVGTASQGSYPYFCQNAPQF